MLSAKGPALSQPPCPDSQVPTVFGNFRWWRSFLCGGSTGIYVVGYCIYFYVWRSDMSGFMQTVAFGGELLLMRLQNIDADQNRGSGLRKVVCLDFQTTLCVSQGTWAPSALVRLFYVVGTQSPCYARGISICQHYSNSMSTTPIDALVMPCFLSACARSLLDARHCGMACVSGIRQAHIQGVARGSTARYKEIADDAPLKT